MKESDIKRAVRGRYGAIAVQGGSCCGGGSSCCGAAEATDGVPQGTAAEALGYTPDQLSSVPEGAELGLGCGNPLALAALRGGETVLDLGCGAGFDCFLAAARVGDNGRVIGVDMTPEMLDRARDNARRGGYGNVEFRLGEIENLPVADASIDLLISNCVINLATDKPRVFREAFRALKPGGRLAISDIVLLNELPAELRASESAYTGCVSGALPREEYLELIRRAGFERVKVERETPFDAEGLPAEPHRSQPSAAPTPAGGASAGGPLIASISVSAHKPV